MQRQMLQDLWETEFTVFMSILTLKNVFVIFTTASWVPNKSLCLACVPPYSITLRINWNGIIIGNETETADHYMHLYPKVIFTSEFHHLQLLSIEFNIHPLSQFEGVN